MMKYVGMQESGKFDPNTVLFFNDAYNERSHVSLLPYTF